MSYETNLKPRQICFFHNLTVINPNTASSHNLPQYLFPLFLEGRSYQLSYVLTL